MNKFLLPLLVLLTTSFTATSQPTGPRPFPTPARFAKPAKPAKPTKTYCFTGAQVRTQAGALQQFEALKPVVVKLRVANAELRAGHRELRTALTLADSTTAVTRRNLGNEEKLRANAEGQWQRYRAKSSSRGWTIAALGALLAGVVLGGLK